MFDPLHEAIAALETEYDRGLAALRNPARYTDAEGWALVDALNAAYDEAEYQYARVQSPEFSRARQERIPADRPRIR